MKTLPDYPCRPGGVVLVGINPSPISVARGHYYQGKHGKRLWKRLQGLGLLHAAVEGREDESFVSAGNGLTDLVKRPTRSARELSADELRRGAINLKEKLANWRPSIILFAYRPPAEYLLGKTSVKCGSCPSFGGISTFLLSSPYAKCEETARVNEQLKALFAPQPLDPSDDDELTNKLLRTDPAFRALVAKSKASPRKPFSTRRG